MEQAGMFRPGQHKNPSAHVQWAQHNIAGQNRKPENWDRAKQIS